MSQKVTTRKGAINEEKEKRQSESPAKEMKKKMATVEKEKQATEKLEKAEKSEKQPEKSTEKTAEKSTDKKDKSADKKESKDKKETQPEKPKEDTSKGEKNEKTEKQESKQQGKVHNGVSDVTLSTNGGTEELNGTDDDDDVMLVIDDDEQHDHLFPELAYDTSDTEGCDAPGTDAPSRSLTRRSQVKATRTPETPRPASDKQTDKDSEESKDSKVLKLKEEAPTSDRKLRSSDSPKRDSKKTQEAKKQDLKEQDEEEKKPEELAKEQEKAEPAKEQQKESATPIAEVHPEVKENEKSAEETSDARSEQFEMEVVVEVEADDEPRKLDTNYSKSRVKVSPYRRSRSVADQTTSSLIANYTGNNTTMEMDITETSVASTDESALDRSFLRAIRNIRGRNSYKQLDTLNIKHLVNRNNRPTLNTSGRDREVTREVRETKETRETIESVSRPTAPVVGRKRGAADQHQQHAPPAPKRGRLLHRIAHSFRRTDTAPEIVGINTDLPLTAPVASGESFDPERLKTSPLEAEPPTLPLATPLAPHETRDNKRCAIM